MNIFVGPNNSGKSSAISAINLIAQTINNPEFGDTPLALNGQFESLGTFLDMVHGNRANTPLGIDLCFDSFSLRLEYKYRSSRREIELITYELSENGRSIIDFSLRKDSFELKFGGQNTETLFPGTKKRRPIFFNLMPLSRLQLPSSVDEKLSTTSPEVRDSLQRIEKTLSRARLSLRRTFGNFDSVSPFRDKPQRTYPYSGETASRIGVTGSNTALMLSGDSSRRGSESLNMISEISRWFRISGIAEAVKIKSLTPKLYEIVMCDVKGIERNICDVGFGCSQVLPVLAASLNIFGGFDGLGRHSRSMLVVQEPEIHLHPNAQAALGSFFSGLLRPGGQIFIETHSDNLVLRIARHVADGLLQGEDVAVFYVHKPDGLSVVLPLSVLKQGGFEPDWPGGFFPQRHSESLGLAQSAYLSSKTESSSPQLEFAYPEEAK